MTSGAVEFGGPGTGFLQFKNTDICLDLICSCGAQCHFDGYFGRFLRCPHCRTVWEVPSSLGLTEVDADDDDGVRDLEPDSRLEQR